MKPGLCAVVTAALLYPIAALAEGERAGEEPLPTLTLEDAIRIADAQNLDMRAARSRLAQAREGSRQAWSGYLPQLAAGGNYTYNSAEAEIAFPAGFLVRDVGFPVGPTFDPEREPGIDNPPGEPTTLVVVPSEFVEADVQLRHQVGGQVQLNQALIAPVLWPAIRNAYLGAELTELNVETARRDILFAVAQLYYGAVGLQEAIEVQERMLEVAIAHERDAQLRYEQGTAPRMAILRARIERTGAEQDVVRARNAYEGTLSSLATLLARSPDFDVVRPPPPEPIDERPGLAEDALARRPDVASARVSVQMAEAGQQMVRNRYFPTLALIATYQLSNVSGFTGEYASWFAGVGLQWNLFDGGLRESELREATARIAESRALSAAAELRVQDEIRRAIIDLKTARANLLTAGEQVELAAENVELVRQSFEAGIATSLEMIDANAALRGAELARINEQLNAELAALALARAAGLFAP
jgi:outer membrane protein TolC